MTADEIIEGPIRGPLFEVCLFDGAGQIWRVYEDGHTEGFPEGAGVLNYASGILAVLRGEIARRRRQAELLAAAVVELEKIPSRDAVLARVRRLMASKTGEEQAP